MHARTIVVSAVGAVVITSVYLLILSLVISNGGFMSLLIATLPQALMTAVSLGFLVYILRSDMYRNMMDLVYGIGLFFLASLLLVIVNATSHTALQYVSILSISEPILITLSVYIILRINS